jgi:hypothetical protein
VSSQRIGIDLLDLLDLGDLLEAPVWVFAILIAVCLWLLMQKLWRPEVVN